MTTETLGRVSHDVFALVDGKTVSFENEEEKFEALAQAWSNEQPGASIVDYDSAAYHQIIGMGWPALPFLLNRLRMGEGHWVYALTCVAGQQAHTDEMEGDADRVIEAWLDWGKKAGLCYGRTTE